MRLNASPVAIMQLFLLSRYNAYKRRRLIRIRGCRRQTQVAQRVSSVIQ